MGGFELFWAGSVSFIQHNDVGKGNLLNRFVAVFDLASDMDGVDHAHHGIEIGAVLDLIIGKEGLGDRGRVCKTSRLNDHPVKSLSTTE